MKREELELLAEKIAERLSRSWVPGPVRPEPPDAPLGGMVPPWAGAAQQLDDVAPRTGRRGGSGRHRPAYDAVTVAARQAAAGRGPSPHPGGRAVTVAEARAGGRVVPVAVSNRHVHLSREDFARLFGRDGQPGVDRPITQPGQYASHERVTIQGPKGRIEGVRVVGPNRDRTQVELSLTDCRKLGIRAPVRVSGDLSDTAPVTLEGPHGSVELAEGAMIAERHLHMSLPDAERLGLKDGDRVDIQLGAAGRGALLQDVIVRAGAAHETEIHLDTDEAAAFGVGTGDTATIVGRPHPRTPRRTSAAGSQLVTERDVARFAAMGLTLSSSAGYIITPAARDRAKALGIWND